MAVVPEGLERTVVHADGTPVRRFYLEVSDSQIEICKVVIVGDGILASFRRKGPRSRQEISEPGRDASDWSAIGAHSRTNRGTIELLRIKRLFRNNPFSRNDWAISIFALFSK
jgi:hypothetical protein